ncbi:hypothetical protein BDZ91DRAFT_251088 [Kalaharituber pfeilii]|nr:hypothetical protein BDZ91DRAFT_251088 [Kalaharituber pfeilii]
MHTQLPEPAQEAPQDLEAGNTSKPGNCDQPFRQTGALNAPGLSLPASSPPLHFIFIFYTMSEYIILLLILINTYLQLFYGVLLFLTNTNSLREAVKAAVQCMRGPPQQ